MGLICEKKRCLGNVSPKVIDYKPKCKSLPNFIIKNIKAECCDKCGVIFGFDNEACDTIDSAIDFELMRRILKIPIGEFTSEKHTAEMLKISVRDLRKHNRIGRGFIYGIECCGVRLYSIKSIELFVKTGDGRFPLKG